jgi:hypothetical protein
MLYNALHYLRIPALLRGRGGGWVYSGRLKYNVFCEILLIIVMTLLRNQ